MGAGELSPPYVLRILRQFGFGTAMLPESQGHKKCGDITFDSRIIDTLSEYF